MDKYNPLYNVSSSTDVEEIMNQQNIQYGAQVWYDLIKTETSESILVDLSESEMKQLKHGEPSDELVQHLFEYCKQGYTFLKTTHKSCQQSTPISTHEELLECLTHSDIIMSLRRYNVSALFFRKWIKMDSEFRAYVYHSNLVYLANYRGEINKNDFDKIIDYIQTKVMHLLQSTYDDYTVDIYMSGNSIGIIEINSPLWLKAGMYNGSYEWLKDSIHGSKVVMCYYRDSENTIEYFEK